MDALDEVYTFYHSFQGESFSIGKSVLGRDIPCMRCGSGSPVVIVQYGIHAREWITSLLALAHISRFSTRGTFYFLPVTNPDGVALALRGMSCVPLERREFLLRLNGNDDFSLWKANVSGVDLNVNFDARWGTGRKNVFSPASENYVGAFPESEPETRALVRFTEHLRPHATVSYHSKGEEIYWFFDQEKSARERDCRIAASLAHTTSYSAQYAVGSVGGYKDWCISALKIPAFTIEVGADTHSHPIQKTSLSCIVSQNDRVPSVLAEELLYGR